MNPRPITRNAAIRHARENVGQPYMLGESWSFNHWLVDVQAWSQVSARPWGEIATTRSQTLINEACRFLSVDPVIYSGGNWTSFVPWPDHSNQ